MLSETIENVPINPKGWLISEKLDGVRAYWDGRTLWSRYGNRLKPPQWFLSKLPNDIALDGELFTKVNDFENATKIVRNLPTTGTWKEIKFSVFDAPLIKKVYKERLKLINQSLAKNNQKEIIAHKHIFCRGQSHLDLYLMNILKKKGEGVILRDPQGYYENKRSASILKVKIFQDSEAKIIGYKNNGKIMKV